MSAFDPGVWHWLQMAAGGGAVGFLVGLTGVGAGALMTPMLITGFGIGPAVAVGTDLLFAAITKASAAMRHHRLGNVQWDILQRLSAGSITAACVTLALLYVLRPDTQQVADVVRGLLGLLLVASAAIVLLCPYLLRRQQDGQGSDDVEVRGFPTLAFGLALGILVTLTSVGAGAIGVAVLATLYPALEARRIVGTDVVHAIPLTFVSGMGHLGLGHVDWTVLGVLLAGSIPGIALGSRLTGRLPDKVLRTVLAAVLLYAAHLLLPYAMKLAGHF